MRKIRVAPIVAATSAKAVPAMQPNIRPPAAVSALAPGKESATLTI
jgi:hypothetical protein